MAIAAFALGGCARGVEDPDKTKRFTVFFQGLLDGKVGDAGLTPAMHAAITPSDLTEIQRLFADVGTFKSLRFLGEDSVQGYRRFHYAAQFSGGARGVMFVLDEDGKIAGFFNE